MSLGGIIATEIERLRNIKGKRIFLRVLEEDNLIEIPPVEAITIVTHDNTYFVSSKGVISNIDQHLPFGLFLIYTQGYIRTIGDYIEMFMPIRRKSRPVAIIYFLNNPYLSERKVMVSWRYKCFSVEGKYGFYVDCRI